MLDASYFMRCCSKCLRIFNQACKCFDRHEIQNFFRFFSPWSYQICFCGHFITLYLVFYIEKIHAFISKLLGYSLFHVWKISRRNSPKNFKFLFRIQISSNIKLNIKSLTVFLSTNQNATKNGFILKRWLHMIGFNRYLPRWNFLPFLPLLLYYNRYYFIFLYFIETRCLFLWWSSCMSAIRWLILVIKLDLPKLSSALIFNSIIKDRTFLMSRISGKRNILI